MKSVRSVFAVVALFAIAQAFAKSGPDDADPDRDFDLPEFTQKFCLPPDALRGLVTYGNPSFVFDMKLTGDRGLALFYFLRYLLQQQLFWLNINHVRDAMGYAIYDGDDLPNILERNLELPVVPKGGFFISGSASSGATVLTAHSWYWLKPHQFSRVLAETYARGAKAADMWREEEDSLQ